MKMPKYVYRFSEGDKDQKDLLGGKGANLAEMTRLDLPVPPGFTITTDACRAYLAGGEVPEELSVQVSSFSRAVSPSRESATFHRSGPRSSSGSPSALTRPWATSTRKPSMPRPTQKRRKARKCSWTSSL